MQAKFLEFRVYAKIYSIEKTRIGNNENNHSFFYNKPEFSTLLGMIKLAKKFDPNIQISSKKENKLINFAEKLENWIEESYV